MVVELADADTRAAPPPEDYDALALVPPSPTGRYGREITKYLREHADTLRTMLVTRMNPS
jgi:menaquinone-dependent protoporphyrinogen IX oxidase